MIANKDWTVWSRNERSVSVGDRHFFAARYPCSGDGVWTIEEVDAAPPQPFRKIGHIVNVGHTRDLSSALNTALDE